MGTSGDILQLLIVTPLQKIHIIEPYVSAVSYVTNMTGAASQLRNLTIEEYRQEKARVALTRLVDQRSEESPVIDS